MDLVERPVAFGRARHLVGVLTSPPSGGARADLPAVIFLNAGIIHRVGPNRLHVNLARGLARSGLPSLRFDLAGIGDSSTPQGEAGTVEEMVRLDIDDAIALTLRETGRAGVVLIGLCSGADNGVVTAARDPRVAGIVLLDLTTRRTGKFYLHHLRRRILRRKTWRLLVTGRHPAYRRLLARAMRRSGERHEPLAYLAPVEMPPQAEMRALMNGILDRGCRVLAIFTAGVDEQYNYPDQFFDLFPDLRRSERVEHAFFADADHTFSRPALQDRLIDTVRAWFLAPDAWTRAASAAPPQAAEGDDVPPAPLAPAGSRAESADR